MKSLHSQGAEGIIFGCTEFPLLIRKGDADLLLFNTLLIQSLAAVDFALGDNPQVQLLHNQSREGENDILRTMLTHRNL